VAKQGGPATRTAARHDQLADDVWSLMARFFFKVGMRHMAQSTRTTGLHPGAIKALQSLDPDVPKPMGALADAWGCDASNVTWIVDRLEERGLVERRTSLTDRRVKTVVLTDEGLAMRRNIDAVWSEAPDQVRALDTDDLMVLADVLRRLRVD
jgi:MarR family transcriptional regulator, organic hydroperoxide resistance regulator